MRKVVYLLGAGFSAPLGLPVMANFLWKARDLYVSDSDKYSHFAKVFNQIERLSYVKNYFESDLLNIEEILSILEMERTVQGLRLAKQFKELIRDTIAACSPKPKIASPERLKVYRIWDDKTHALYGTYALSMMRLQASVQTQVDFRQPKAAISVSRARTSGQDQVKYAVVTLNYDEVLETFLQSFYEASQRAMEPLPIWDLPSKKSPGKLNTQQIVPLCKLHGTIGAAPKDIIPPTWSKRVPAGLLRSWKVAFSVLHEATDLRIVGYSFPLSDAYVRYLLKAAVRGNQNLQHIDALVLDPNGAVRKRLDEFITFRDFRFKSADVKDFLQQLYDRTFPRPTMGDTVKFTLLEEVHDTYFRDV